MTKHVIDANVLIHGSGVELPFTDMITVPEVTKELESAAAQTRFEAHEIELREPEDRYVEQVEEQAGKMGQEFSEVDTRLLALALQLDAVLVTDDYGMQNVAAELSVSYEGFLKEEIEGSQEWEKVCSRCGKVVEGDRCRRCGGEAMKVWK